MNLEVLNPAYKWRCYGEFLALLTWIIERAGSWLRSKKTELGIDLCQKYDRTQIAVVPQRQRARFEKLNPGTIQTDESSCRNFFDIIENLAENNDWSREWNGVHWNKYFVLQIFLVLGLIFGLEALAKIMPLFLQLAFSFESLYSGVEP